MLLWVLAVWAALTAHDLTGARDDPFRLPRRLALVGLIFGLALSSRFVNGLLAPLLGLLLVLYAPPSGRARTVWLGLAIIPAVALLTSWAIWPRLWEAPIASLLESWERLRNPHAPAPYLGEITNTPARHYFAVYLAATAPAGILAGAVLWGGRAWRRRERGSIALALWLAIPLLVLASPVRQDGVRYIMPAVIALSLAAAAGFDELASSIARRWARGGRWLATIGGAALFAYLAIVCARIHPYYLNYYGEHVGGPARVAEAQTFEIAWWGEGLHEAIAYLNEHAEPNAAVHKACVLPNHLAWMRYDLWASEVRRVERARWIVIYGPSWRDCPVPDDAERVFEVRAQGAPLARVYRRPEVSPPPAGASRPK